MKYAAVLFLFFLTAGTASAQNDFINAEHPVYSFLKSMSVKGLIPEYSDAVLPFTRKYITDCLSILQTKKNYLSSAETALAEKYLIRFSNSAKQIIVENPRALWQDEEKRFYFFSDSIVNFSVSPALEFTGSYSGETKKSSMLAGFGGSVYGSYSSWFGFSVKASNSIVKGDRTTASLLDQRVRSSFTFNKTGLNYFDETSGHFAIHSGIFESQVGRERILWGRGYTNRLILSENPPLFDFIRFKLQYKSLNYNFQHGWLVQKPEVIFTDSLRNDYKGKASKYIASNRLGIKLPSFEIGASQVIIYANRPVEASYLNPFLLWESAQRSMNDLDNSFLIFDGEWYTFPGLSLSGSYLFDDINFNLFDDWNNISNRSAWQIGAFITYPLFFRNTQLRMEYTQVRPYTYSHYGKGESLSYTTNGYMLGYKYNPNSAVLSLRIDYYLSAKTAFSFSYNFIRHGANETDSTGSVLKNFGGDVFVFPRWSDPDKTYLFDGIISENHELRIAAVYELLQNYYLNFNAGVDFRKTGKSKDSVFSGLLSLKLFFE